MVEKKRKKNGEFTDREIASVCAKQTDKAVKILWFDKTV